MNTPPQNHDPHPTWPQPHTPAREPLFNIPAVVLLLAGICIAVHAVRIYLLSNQQDVALLISTAFIPLRYSGDFPIDIYAFTSTVTYAFLHGNWMHLIVNLIWLMAFGSPLAKRLGPLRFVLFWVVTAWGAVALHYAMHANDQIPLVGASGAISGMMGAAARFGFQIDRSQGGGRFSGPPLTIAQTLSSRTVLAFLALWLVVNLISGMGYLTPEGMGDIAWEAHVGGLLVGFFGISLFSRDR